MSKPKLNRLIDVPEYLIKKLLTDSEWRMIKQRYLIVQLLKQGLSIRQVAAKAKVGTDTVVRTSKKLKPLTEPKGTLRQISSSKWVFGQIGSEKS